MRLRHSLNFCVAALSIAVALARPTPAGAHLAREAPWHPIAAAYRSSVFMTDLAPVPWLEIEAAWEHPHPATTSADAPIDRLEAIDGDAAAEVRAAILAGNRQALYESATRAVSVSLRAALSDAEAALEGGEPARPLAEARALWRAFEPFVREADPAGWRRVGRAWLELADSAGAPGLAGAGAVAADPVRFVAARAVIESYLFDNYEPAAFGVRHHTVPLPERVVERAGDVEMAPWLPPGSSIGDQTPLPRLVLSFELQGIDEADLPLVAYGDMLFDSPAIFGEPARSLGLACSTCHNRSDINRDFFIPGISHRPGSVDVDGSFFHPVFNDLRADPIDIPSLRGIRFTGPYGRDGRIASLREFTRNVIVGEFGGAEPTPFMLDALVAYMFEFAFLPNAQITGDGMLSDIASEAARRGAAIFRRPFPQMGGKSCATCHIPSANFLDRRVHSIGSGAADGTNAFDTPTLLGARFTAPYFHDGSLPTLASVVDWFETRYGLGLADAERADLTAYLEAVGDGDAPYEVFEGRETPFRLAFGELTTFASTLNMLIPRRDARHALLMIDTVAADLVLDAGAMANLDAKPEVYALAGILADVGAAIEAGDWGRAAQHWAAFRERQAEIDERMF